LVRHGLRVEGDVVIVEDAIVAQARFRRDPLIDGPAVADPLPLLPRAQIGPLAAAWPMTRSETALLMASICWAAAFLLFAVRYGPMLLGGRRAV
jgi:uncharacterized protein involved in response to NO